MISRRQLLAGCGATLLHRSVQARPNEAQHYTLSDIEVPGDPRIGQRFTLLRPKNTTHPVPLLVLLHGLGETGDQRTGAHAWVQRYGLGRAYDRLCQPPVKPLYPQHRHWAPGRLKQLNQSLEQRPFQGLAIACPYTPNVYRAPNRQQRLDAYANWLTEVVIPRARREAPIIADAEHTSLNGCSLGGYVGIEVFLRKPTVFHAWGSVQGALGAHRIANYARRLVEVVKKHGPRRLLLETSTADSFRTLNERLSRDLTAAGLNNDLLVPPGPHNQPFLRDSGTLEMLLWHDRLYPARHH